MTMTWNEVILYIIETFIKLIVVAAIPYGFKQLKNIVKNETANKYLDRFEQLIKDAVDQVQQTYVDNLKAENLFDKDAQKKAFEMVKANVLNMMNDRMKDIVVEAVGDFDGYMMNKIEAEVHNIHMKTAIQAGAE